MAFRSCGANMRRRQFIAGLGCAAAMPLSARAQEKERVRRIGFLLSASPGDAEFQAWVSMLLQTLAPSGWIVGRNLQIETRWAGGNAVEAHRHAAELVSLGCDVIVAHGASVLGPLLQTTRTVPVVFPIASDPVGAGFDESLARPGGNATGFLSTEWSLAAKWLELLKEIAPRVTRAAVLRDVTQGAGAAQFAAVQTVAPSLRVEVAPINMRDAGEIERGVAALARSSGGGLVITSGPGAIGHRDLIVKLAARHKLPAVYYERFFALGGGLATYGPDFYDNYRRSAGYVDRILKGEKPADLPVQAPTIFKLTINVKTAKALGLEVPASVLARADEVIE
jgi:putative tryptophan/tyrosine transport system substrate-binding protein